MLSKYRRFPMTIQILLNDWLENYKKDEVKTRTYSRYQGLISMHIVPALGERNISDLGWRDIQEFLTQQKKDGNMRNREKLSATSTNMMLSILNLAFEYACDRFAGCFHSMEEEIAHRIFRGDRKFWFGWEFCWWQPVWHRWIRNRWTIRVIEGTLPKKDRQWVSFPPIPNLQVW